MKNIIVEKNRFCLNTKSTSYVFRVSEYGHLEHIHYGKKVDIGDADALALKRVVQYGSSINYKGGDDNYSLDVLPQEYDFSGRGDFREPAISVRVGNSSDLDLLYESFEVVEGDLNPKKLPSSYDADESLVVHLSDSKRKIDVDLVYGVFYDSDVITRRTIITNHNKDLTINKLMSFSMDMLEDDMTLVNFNGAWIRETHRNDRDIKIGTYVSRAHTGFSSNKTNPGFLLKKRNTSENSGEVWGFNLIYSGNHYSSVSLDEHGSIRVMSGIDYEDFNLKLGKDEVFETPVEVMTYSNSGLNDMSHHFHDFINNHIVRSIWKNRERPILINSWEAFMFDFKKSNLLSLASDAKKLGIELFVLDDGWFSNRNDDTKGLGDYDCNEKKLPGGLKELSSSINSLDMGFGLWVEPEAINIDSKLYKEHPDWAIASKDRENVFGRHELLLDLRKKVVRDYIVRNINKLIDENNIDYIKWDMNRHMVGLNGEENHDYILGLYDVLSRIFYRHPNVLLETCSSGGNRFDLGMLCYSPQIWCSDNTDPIERLDIQKGLSYLYPLSTFGAHVSASPHSQTLRNTPLNTRFNVASYGCLGYELDLKMLSSLEKKEIKKQIEFYKEHRSTFQYGRFYRFEEDENKETFEVLDKECIVTRYRRLIHAAPGVEKLKAVGLDDKNYNICPQPFDINIKQFGNLINFVLPVKVNANGIIVNEVSKYKGMTYSGKTLTCSNKALEAGIPLDNLFEGTGYNDRIRLPLDYGSEMYLIKEKEDESGEEK